MAVSFATARSMCRGSHLCSPCGDLVDDGDGVVVLPGAEIDRILSASAKRVEKEADIMKRLRAGETTLEIFGWNK